MFVIHKHNLGHDVKHWSIVTKCSCNNPLIVKIILNSSEIMNFVKMIFFKDFIIGT